MKKLLIVEAHSDDSSLGITGYLLRYSAMLECHFLMLACSDIKMFDGTPVTREQRLQEYERYVSNFNGIWHRGVNNKLPLDADTRLELESRSKIVNMIESVINDVKPDQLIVQAPSFHHDHVVVYEASIAATRPTSKFYPKEIYLMENPTYVHSLGLHTDFKPDFYISMTDEEVDLKLKHLRNWFPSQIREDRNSLSLEGIKSWARYRGIEARCLYAEALQTYKRII